MRKHKIFINREPISEVEIESAKNFESVMKLYQSKTMMSKYFFSIVAVASIVAIATLLFFALNIKEEKTAVANKKPFIDTPFNKNLLPFEKYYLYAEIGDTITYSSGSKIIIPSNIFIDKNNKPVSGKVEIKYREFHNPTEIFLSGIPMIFDSVNQKYHFESAGMFEIYAEQNGVPLNIINGKEISIQMISYDNRNIFNSYYLDTNLKAWVSNGKDSIIYSETNYVVKDSLPDNNTLEAKLIAVQNVINQYTLNQPILPKKADENKKQFSIDFSKDEFPELVPYQNVLFEIDNSVALQTEQTKITWNNVSISKTDIEGIYNITFVKLGQKYSVNATPVFKGNDFAKATQVYYEHKKILANKQKEEQRIREELNVKYKLIEEQIIADNKKYQEEIELSRAKEKTSEVVFRYFAVNKFGVWNSDMPCNLPKSKNFNAIVLNNKTNQQIQCDKYYLIESGRNALFTYYSLNNFKFNPTTQNVLIGVTNTNKLVVVKQEAFTNIDLNKSNITLQATVEEHTISSINDVSKYIGI